MNYYPKVSICIPTYNRCDYLKQTIESVLAQDYPNFEVIISNNASTDNTLELLSSYSDQHVVLLHQNTNVGMMGNWNKCLAAATGEFFLLLSDDDLLDPFAISEMVSYYVSPIKALGLAKNDIGVVICRGHIINAQGNIIAETRGGPLFERGEDLVVAFFEGKRGIFPSFTLFRTKDLKEQNGYHASEYPLAADAHAWINSVFVHGNAIWTEKRLAYYREHFQSTTQQVNIETWIKENTALAMFCIDSLQNQLSMSLRGKIIERLRKAIIGYNARLIVELINRSARSMASVLHGLKLYYQFISYFTKLNALLILLDGVVRLVTPDVLRNTLRPLKRYARLKMCFIAILI